MSALLFASTLTGSRKRRELAAKTEQTNAFVFLNSEYSRMEQAITLGTIGIAS